MHSNHRIVTRIRPPGTLQFILHKGAGKVMRWPRAEDATNYYTLEDLRSISTSQ